MKAPSIFRLATAVIATSLIALGGVVRAEVVQPCDNCNSHGPAGDPCPKGGSNPFSVYSGNAHRETLDISVFGSVGKMPLRFMRYSNTRMAAQTSSQGRFGREGVWTHNYQWFLRDGGNAIGSPATLRLGYPDGAM